MTRSEIHRRALRAAAAVSLTVGLAACAGSVIAETELGDEEPGTMTSSGGGAGSSSVASTASAGGATASSGGGAGSSSVASTASAGGSTSVTTGGGGGGGGAPGECAALAESDWEAYAACCEENGWSWEAGCTPWGPPVPPSLEAVA